MTPSVPLPARLSGAVWGHLVGDALGVPYEFRTADQITDVVWRGNGTHQQPAGTWSDDGALMLALLDSLLDAGFDPEDQARRSLAWFDTGAYAPGGTVFDVGGATRTAMAAIRSGTPATDAGPSGEFDNGNGSLMGILPLALVERSVSDERLVEMAHLASRVTHGHPRCQVACALYSLVVRRLLTGTSDRANALADARSRLRATYLDGGLSAHLDALDELEGWTGRSGRGYVLDSFWSAWDAFAGADSYQEAVVRAIRYGRDTDTTAAIAGGLAGAWFGIDDIPTEWRVGLREPTIIRRLVDGLIETDTSHGTWRTSTESPLRAESRWLGGPPTGCLTTCLPMATVPTVNEPLEVTDPELSKLLAVIVEDFAPVEVILFGSQARGDARPDSDFDVAVIMPEGTHRRHTTGMIYQALGRVHGRKRGIDVVVLNAGEVDRGRDDIGTVAREIARDGRSIYRRPVAVGV